MIFIFLIILSSYVFSEGLSSADFLKIVDLPRNIAMADSRVALAEQIEALNLNPAGLANLEKRNVVFSHTEWIEDIGLEYFGYGQKIFNGGAGLSIFFLHQGEFDNLDLEGNIEGNINAYDLAVNIGYGKNFSSLHFDYSLGGALKFINRKLAKYSSSTFAIDLGFKQKMQLLKNKITTIGLSLQNIGPGVKFINESYSLPIIFRIGIGQHAYQSGKHSLYLGISLVNYFIDKVTTLNTGIEYLFSDIISIRAGYTIGESVPYNVSAGLGLVREYKGVKYIFDLSLSPNYILGNTYSISICAQF
jgi:hypothetical protein